jgi:membrane protein DedA with SNARE-associated domain
MDAWNQLTSTVWWLLNEHGLLLSFILLLLEESGIPPVIPGDLLMVLMGVQAAQGKVGLLVVLVVLEVATVIGGSILYALSAIGGQAIVSRVGPYVGATPARLKKLDDSLKRHGEIAIVLGRLIPSLCILTAVAAGLLGFPYRRYVFALALGGFIHMLICVMLGYWVGPPVIEWLTTLHPSFEVTASVLALAGLTAWLIRSVRRTPRTPILLSRGERLRRGLLAGLLGGLAWMLLANILLPLGSPLFQPTAFESAIVLQIAQYGSARAVPVIVAVALLAGSMLWGALYGLVQPALPGPAWLRGAIFAVVPLAVSLLLLQPLTGHGRPGLALEDGWLPMVGEAVRWLVYGLTLGAGYVVMSLHRPARTRTRRECPAPRD